MGLFSKDIKTMDDLFVHTLKDIYYAENQIAKALPGMVEKATDSGLKQGFQSHLTETKGHIQRLEQVFKMHGVKVEGVNCRPSTVFSRKPTRSPARSRTSRCSTPL